MSGLSLDMDVMAFQVAIFLVVFTPMNRSQEEYTIEEICSHCSSFLRNKSDALGDLVLYPDVLEPSIRHFLKGRMTTAISAFLTRHRISSVNRTPLSLSFPHACPAFGRRQGKNDHFGEHCFQLRHHQGGCEMRAEVGELERSVGRSKIEV